MGRLANFYALEMSEPEVKGEAGNCSETSCQSITFEDCDTSSLSLADSSRFDKAKSVYLNYTHEGGETSGDS
ncbi:hypothetical protein EMCRGX_G007667 [Ephydatia muelleri]